MNKHKYSSMPRMLVVGCHSMIESLHFVSRVIPFFMALLVGIAMYHVQSCETCEYHIKYRHRGWPLIAETGEIDFLRWQGKESPFSRAFRRSALGTIVNVMFGGAMVASSALVSRLLCQRKLFPRFRLFTLLKLFALLGLVIVLFQLEARFFALTRKPRPVATSDGILITSQWTVDPAATIVGRYPAPVSIALSWGTGCTVSIAGMIFCRAFHCLHEVRKNEEPVF